MALQPQNPSRAAAHPAVHGAEKMRQSAGTAAAEPEPDRPSDLDDLTHAEYRVLYEEAGRNVLFAKRQQWRVVEYFTLLALALVAVGGIAPFPRDVARFAAFFLLFAGAAAAMVLIFLQSWQYREQLKMARLAEGFSTLSRAVLRLKAGIGGDLQRYFILAAMLLFVIVLDLVAFRLLNEIGG